jgi:diphthamide biosynthesis methyltransferase
MTTHEISIIDKQLKGINLRLIWALVVCTAVSVSTVLSVYYGFKTDMIIQKAEIKLLEARIERIENNLNRQL